MQSHTATVIHSYLKTSILFGSKADVPSLLIYLSFFPPCYGLIHPFISDGAGVAQSVQCLTMDWKTRRSGFDARQGQSILL
jgi:hypothetical protein